MATRASRIHPANCRASLCFDVAVTILSAAAFRGGAGPQCSPNRWLALWEGTVMATAAPLRRGARIALATIGFTLAFLAHTAPASAAGIDSARLSLPKGPGSVEGLGRTFEASPASGTASYGVDIAVPPAIGGFGPALSLAYDGGTGTTEVGLGWSLGGLPRIRRRTEDGLPRFDATDAFELVGFGSVPELVQVSPGTYRFKHETGSFVRVQQGNGTVWEARSKGGTVYRFGGEGCVEAEGTAVATYLLCEQFDLHGHRIAYAWNTTGGWARLSKVTWNDLSEGARLNVDLSYEPRPDVQTKFSSGIRQTLIDRLSSLVSDPRY